MKKYIAIIKAAWYGQMVYRINFFTHRLGNLFEIFSQIIIWSVIFNNQSIVSGYSYNEMITYIVVGWLFMFMTANYGLEFKVSEDIQTGRMSNMLIKPISYLRYIVTLSIGRVSIAMSTAIGMQILVFVLLKNIIIFNFDFFLIIILLAMLIVGYFIRLFFSIIIGFASFWTMEISGIIICSGVIIKFLSGAFFPINLLPSYIVKIFTFFPFVYTFYTPTQIYLGKISLAEGVKGLGIEILWLLVLYLIIKLIWKKGLKKYEGVGI